MTTKTKHTTPKVGMKIWCQQPELSEAVKMDSRYYHDDAEIIHVDKHNIRVKWTPAPQVTHLDCIFPAKNLENFWEVFALKEQQGFCYDKESIWLAHDGDGGIYSYDSEAAVNDYAAKNDEADSICEIYRSEREKAAPEMYVLLKRIHERLMDFQTGKSKTLKDIMGLMPRIGDAVEAAEKDTDLKQIVEFLKIPAPY